MGAWTAFFLYRDPTMWLFLCSAASRSRPRLKRKIAVALRQDAGPTESSGHFCNNRWSSAAFGASGCQEISPIRATGLGPDKKVGGPREAAADQKTNLEGTDSIQQRHTSTPKTCCTDEPQFQHTVTNPSRRLLRACQLQKLAHAGRDEHEYPPQSRPPGAPAIARTTMPAPEIKTMRQPVRPGCRLLGGI
jgi:hypothetical protein